MEYFTFCSCWDKSKSSRRRRDWTVRIWRQWELFFFRPSCCLSCLALCLQDPARRSRGRKTRGKAAPIQVGSGRGPASRLRPAGRGRASPCWPRCWTRAASCAWAPAPPWLPGRAWSCAAKGPTSDGPTRPTWTPSTTRASGAAGKRPPPLQSPVPGLVGSSYRSSSRPQHQAQRQVQPAGPDLALCCRHGLLQLLGHSVWRDGVPEGPRPHVLILRLFHRWALGYVWFHKRVKKKKICLEFRPSA